MKSMLIWGNLRRPVVITIHFCTIVVARYVVLRLVILPLLRAQSSPPSLSRPFVPPRPRSLSHFLPFLPARELPPRGPAAPSIVESFLLRSRELSRRGSPCRLGNRISFFLLQRQRQHSKAFELGEREKERGGECNLPKSPSLAIPRDRLRFRAQIQQEFLAIRDALLFPFANRPAVFCSATNCHCDGRY